MTELVFLLEGQSEAALLDGLMPRLLPGVPCRKIPFKGKQDMEKQMVRRIRGYQNPEAKFILLRDQDSGDCGSLKRRLLEKCREAGKEILVRIACHEIESWYLADLTAVEKGLGVPNLARHQNRMKYREPDTLGSPERELRRLTGNLYQEVGGSRAIGPLLDLDNKRSRSFAVFVEGIKSLMGVRPPRR